MDLKEVSDVCPFKPAGCLDSLAIAKRRDLTIGTIWTIELPIRSIPLGEQARRICHQKQSQTYAICSVRYNHNEDSEMHFIQLLDDENFEFISTYPLDQFEIGCSILSCSFSDDTNAYYCVGTAYNMQKENESGFDGTTAYKMQKENESDYDGTTSESDSDAESDFDAKYTGSTKGRILVFMVEYKKLQLVAETKTEAVYSLNALNGKLFAATKSYFKLYEWMLRDDGTRNLQLKCSRTNDLELPPYVQTRGDSIVVGRNTAGKITELTYEPGERHIEVLATATGDRYSGRYHSDGPIGAIEKRARAYEVNWVSAVEILDEDTVLGAAKDMRLFTVSKNRGVPGHRAVYEACGDYHLGEFVTRFRHGSLGMRLPDLDVGKIPTVIFGTNNGVIGVVASLPEDLYRFMEKLQTNLRDVVEGVGGLSHEEWRSQPRKMIFPQNNLLDGDLIETFLYLEPKKEIISGAMAASVEEICEKVKKLTMLR